MAGQKVDRRAVLDELLKRPNLPAVEELFRLLKGWGLGVNNLCHRMDGQWQANLRTRDATDYFKFAYGPTASDALLAALQRVVKGEYASRPPVDDDDVDAGVVGATRLGDDSSAADEPDDDLIG